jgi:CHAT domain-containing protein
MVEPIYETLGHSIVYEEQKGDFAAARNLAEAGLSQARQQNEPAGLADALLMRGLVHLLLGETAAAVACFQETRQVVPGDANRCLRAAGYDILAAHEQFNEYFDGRGANSVEVSDRSGGIEARKAQDTVYQNLRSQATDPTARFDAWLAYDFLTMLQVWRATLAAALSSRSPLPLDQLTEQALHGAETLRQSRQAGSTPSLAAIADLMAADLCHRAGQLTRAQGYLDSALAVYGQSGDQIGTAVCHMTQGDWLSAPFSSPLAWNLAVEDSSTEGSNLAWQTEEKEFSLTGYDGPRAKAEYDTAEALFARAGATRGLAALQLRRGYLAMLEGDYAAGAAAAERAGRGFDLSGDLRGCQLAQAHLGLSHIGAGRPEGVNEIARQIGAWGAGGGSFTITLSIGILFNRAGRHWLIRKGDYERALACYRASEFLFTALGASVNSGQSLVDQAVTYEAVGERTTALTLYEQALDALEKELAGRPQLAGKLRSRLITLATHVYHLCLQEMDPAGMQRGIDRIEAQVAALPGGESDPGMLVQDWALLGMASCCREQARVLVPLYRGLQARDAGSPAEAESLFDQALDAAKARSTADGAFLEAVVQGSRKRYAEAQVAFDRYLAAGGANAGLAGQLTDVMSTHFGQGQTEARAQAMQTLKQAFSFMIRVKDYARCQQYLRKLEEVGGRNWWQQDDRPWVSLSDCGATYEGLGDLSRALKFYDCAIERLEARRKDLSREELKTALAADQGAQYLYFYAARTAIAAGDPARAFEYAEQGKARALLDLMAASNLRAPGTESEGMRGWRETGARLSLRRGLLAQARGQSQPDANRIAYLVGLVEADNNQLAALELDLARSDPDFHRAINPQARTLSLGEVRAALPPDAVLLQYFFLSEDLLAWAITRDGAVQTYHAPIDAKALARQIAALHRACANRGPVEPLASELAAILIEPFAERIRASRRLLISPYGAAHLLPFHALPFDGQPLVAIRAVSYLPSASSLQFLAPDSLPPKGFRDARMLAVGNPAAMSCRLPLADKANPLPSLPAAGTEAAFVASLFLGSTALIGGDAGEEAVRTQIPGHSLLHFATHGILSEEAPLSSAVALANGGELTVYELMGLRLQVDLVVLSACETALGRTTGGDDILGLTRGLLAAGARGAVVSLWPVNDATTSLFMGEFYRQLRDGRTPAVALLTAQNYLAGLSRAMVKTELAQQETVLRQWKPTGTPALEPALRQWKIAGTPTLEATGCSHPFYWAPFILVG